MTVAGGVMSQTITQSEPHSHLAGKRPVFVSTWNFGQTANEASL
ncbi:MAG TPA: glycosylasparaginase, partial [Verrucomicrobiales bacterium]|nr:glycosylasparaginase [Verrucomicrobiales bacterium]